MRLSRILTIYRKDVRDAIRDARVLMAIIVPFGLGIFYNLVMDDDNTTTEATIVWAGDSTSQLPDQLVKTTEGVVDVTLDQVVDEAAVREKIANEDADIGLVIPDGFDQQIASGTQPSLTVIRPQDPSIGSDYVAASLAPVLRSMAGQDVPAQLDIQSVEEQDSSNIITRVGLRKYFVLASIIMLVGMIAMLAVPVILADEADKHTLDALVMVASYGEVVTAKALFGITYIVIGVPLLLAITGIMPVDTLLFFGGLAAFSIALVGFGLLLGGLFTASQLNTWGGLLLLPVLFPAFVTGLPVPRALELIALAIPTSHATRICLNAISGEAIFDQLWLSFVVIALWALAGYGLLLWRLSRREA
ncbi:MAG TPA: ABC transporter permease [Thermomicrobiales bacterium]|nr:ABC transporter permease [Thermomicrobiales bacterium]